MSEYTKPEETFSGCIPKHDDCPDHGISENNYDAVQVRTAEQKLASFKAVVSAEEIMARYREAYPKVAALMDKWVEWEYTVHWPDDGDTPIGKWTSDRAAVEAMLQTALGFLESGQIVATAPPIILRRRPAGPPESYEPDQDRTL